MAKEFNSDAELAPKSKVQLFNLSRRSAEMSKIMRVNAETATTLKYVNDLGPKAMRSKTPIVKRRRTKGEAPPSTAADWRKRPVYKSGDGEVSQMQRLNSDHSHLKTFGFPT